MTKPKVYANSYAVNGQDKNDRKTRFSLEALEKHPSWIHSGYNAMTSRQLETGWRIEEDDTVYSMSVKLICRNFAENYKNKDRASNKQ